MAHGAAGAGSAVDMIWAYLVHLSYNMWSDRDVPERDVHFSSKPYLRFDDGLWNDILPKMADVGINTVVIDLGDGVRYQSHPEIAVENAWSVARLRRELARLRGMGLEPIPKLNFSTCHDAWLGPYARCISTEQYYEICRDLIGEAIDIFEPRLFHLGMDEETAHHQRHYACVVIRQHELWWHDLEFLVGQVEECGARAWVWSDYVWEHGEAFYSSMPTSVLQSNWYYGADFGEEVTHCRAYLDLELHGYDQIPTGSNWSTDGNMAGTVAYCAEHIAPERLCGFLQTVWRPTLEACREQHMRALDLVGEARAQLVRYRYG
jgi:hypothetical protein